jgi:hypothetical protein
MGDGTPVRAAAAGEDAGADLAARNAALEVLNARHPTADYVLGYDGEGWHAWSRYARVPPGRPELHASTPEELDGLLGALLELPGWLREHPGAEVHVEDGQYHGSYPFSGLGTRLWAGPVPESGILAAMKVLAEHAAGCERLEREFPGWLTGVSPEGEWLAFTPGSRKLQAADEDGLRGQLATATGRTAPS